MPATLATFLARYDRPIAAQARAALRKLRALLPGAVELVHDNYNALVIAFGASERQSDLVVSIALYPRWVTMFFWNGARLKDPTCRLQGSGKQVRGIRLAGAADLDAPDVIALIEQAAAGAIFTGRKQIIKSVVARQRPRRPSPVRAGRRR
ncbi:MAG TPA: DUF1801 domain-containing protein [Kofleriaceae bacterium]|nr:DUF1801 domain-containing protein [Kofleriaceae bacterium]